MQLGSSNHKRNPRGPLRLLGLDLGHEGGEVRHRVDASIRVRARELLDSDRRPPVVVRAKFQRGVFAEGIAQDRFQSPRALRDLAPGVTREGSAPAVEDDDPFHRDVVPQAADDEESVELPPIRFREQGHQGGSPADLRCLQPPGWNLHRAIRPVIKLNNFPPGYFLRESDDRENDLEGDGLVGGASVMTRGSADFVTSPMSTETHP